MISATNQTNTFTGGMNCDTDITFLPNDLYRYALDVRITTNDNGTTGVLLSIEGAKKYNFSIPKYEKIIGVTSINDIAVVVTKYDETYNKIYKIVDFDKPNPLYTVVVKGNLGLCSNSKGNQILSIVGNYETSSNIKVYLTDGETTIKMINIASNKYVDDGNNSLLDVEGNILNPLALDITPTAILPPFEITDLVSGTLPSGKVQYCYQLFNEHGPKSNISPLSNMVHLTSSSATQSGQTYEGTPKGESSGKGCTMQTTLRSTDFDRCRIIRILYESNNLAPTFNIISDIVLDTTNNTITFTDTGSSSIGTLTLEEFNSLNSYMFNAKSIVALSNRLFAANITEQSWTPTIGGKYYDARAYRANNNGQFTLHSASGATYTGSISSDSDLSRVPKDHDCINPYNSANYYDTYASNLYIYGSNSVMGGRGLNVSYNFIVANLREVLEVTASNTISSNDVGMRDNPTYFYNIAVTGIGHSYNNSVPIASIAELYNQANPKIASRFTGYLRDEIYRFGVTFYNNKGVASPVMWIGDIRFPHVSQNLTGIVPYEYQGGNLYSYPIGIKFTVNMPDDAIAYEIVRCDRTLNDRTVLMLGCVQPIVEYRIKETSDDKFIGVGQAISASNERRPYVAPILPALSHEFWMQQINARGDGYNWSVQVESAVDIDDTYWKLITPEICISGDSVTSLLKEGCYIEPHWAYYSNINSSGMDTGWGFVNNKLRSFATNTVTLREDGSEVTFTANDMKYNMNGNKNGESTSRDLFIVMRDATSNAYISKMYFTALRNNSWSRAEILDAKYPPIMPYNAILGVGADSYKINIGDITYVNWGMSTFKDKPGEGNQTITGPSGPGTIIRLLNSNTGNLWKRALNQVGYLWGGGLGVNIKKNVTPYGGNTYNARINSIYISTGSYNTVSNTGVEVFGGDTYIGILDYPNTMLFLANETDTWRFLKHYMGFYMPVESSVNLHLLMGDMTHSTWRESDNYIDAHMLVDITLKQDFHVQDRPFYFYNTAYSAVADASLFTSKALYSEDNLHSYNRIYSSEVKAANEVTDSWTLFKVANYLDVDSRYGEITNLVSFRDLLLYFLENALGIASVNERSLIQDGSVGGLVLGTGDILSRFDYVTTMNGTGVYNDKSIISSDSSLYWYDSNKNEICNYTGQVNFLSKLKQVLSYLNEMYDAKTKNACTLFDKKYNEVWFKLYNKSLIFNEQVLRFTSFYTHDPDWALHFRNKVVTIKNNEFYVINSLDIDGFGETQKNSQLKLVVNKDPLYTKVFDNVILSGEFVALDNSILRNNIFEYANFSTKHLTSNPDNITTDYREETYRMPVPRQKDSEQKDNMSFPARMRGKYMICDYGFKSNKDYTFSIPYIATNYRYSLI